MHKIWAVCILILFSFFKVHAQCADRLQETNVYKNRSDTLSIIAINTMARDTSVHAPFHLTAYPGTNYSYDSHNLNMQKACH